MATSAAFAGVMTAAERFGMKGVLSSTQKALGLGGNGLASLYSGQFKQFGKQMLRGALAKGEAGITEFGTEYMQEVLGQISQGVQDTEEGSLFKYIDGNAALQSGIGGAITGFALPFFGSYDAWHSYC